jgi:hypothetical protein
MRRILKRRPSPAMILAVIALIVALAGTAIAGGGFVTKKKLNNKINTTVRGPVQYSVTTQTIPGGGTYAAVSAVCPAGTKVIGGGIKIPDPNPTGNNGASFLDDAYPTTVGYTGHVVNANAAATAVKATTIAICATVSTTLGSPPAS